MNPPFIHTSINAEKILSKGGRSARVKDNSPDVRTFHRTCPLSIKFNMSNVPMHSFTRSGGGFFFANFILSLPGVIEEE